MKITALIFVCFLVFTPTTTQADTVIDFIKPIKLSLEEAGKESISVISIKEQGEITGEGLSKVSFRVTTTYNQLKKKEAQWLQIDIFEGKLNGNSCRTYLDAKVIQKFSQAIEYIIKLSENQELPEIGHINYSYWDSLSNEDNTETGFLTISIEGDRLSKWKINLDYSRGNFSCTFYFSSVQDLISAKTIIDNGLEALKAK